MVNQSKMKQKCKICGYKTDRTTVLKNHVRIVHPGKYYCAKKICKKIVDGSMENHEETEHQDPEKRFKCDMCIKKFDRLNTLLNHKTKNMITNWKAVCYAKNAEKDFLTNETLQSIEELTLEKRSSVKIVENFFGQEDIWIAQRNQKQSLVIMRLLKKLAFSEIAKLAAKSVTYKIITNQSIIVAAMNPWPSEN